MVPAINYLAVLAALIASMVIGAVFYHRAVFGRTWMRLVGHSDDTVQGGSPLAYPIVVVASFLTAWALAGATYLAYEFYEGSFLLSALVTRVDPLAELHGCPDGRSRRFRHALPEDHRAQRVQRFPHDHGDGAHHRHLAARGRLSRRGFGYGSGEYGLFGT